MEHEVCEMKQDNFIMHNSSDKLNKEDLSAVVCTVYV